MEVSSRPTEALAGAPVLRRSRSHVGDRVFGLGTLGAALGLLVLLGAILWVLGSGSWQAFSRFGLGFVTGRTWNAVPGRESFGALPYIFATLVTSAVAVALAVPVAVGVALFVNEVPVRWIRDPLAVFVDLLAAIPSVVYGTWGFLVLVPYFGKHVEPFLARTVGEVPLIGRLFSGTPGATGNMLVAGVVLAIMILPIITAVTREVFAVVPRELREGALALGATGYETVRMAVLPPSRAGIVGATMLGLGRALGETIAVALTIGNFAGINASLFQPAYSIPAKIANEFREANTGLHRSALLALALLLIAVSLLMAALSRLVVSRAGRAFTEDRAAGSRSPTTETT